MDKAGVSRGDLSAIAFTRGPGLIGSLMVGVSFAKGLSLSLDIPLIDVHHMQAHVLAHFIEEPKPALPFLCLTVSGGHTQIVKVTGHLQMEILGETRDDAAGEAFDKTAKLLGLPYPGGPLIDEYARKGDPQRFEFPQARMQGLDFSFSGLKTAVMYFLRDRQKEDPDFISHHINDICASIQYAINASLVAKLRRAVRETGIAEVAIAGGVAANSGLRAMAQKYAEKDGWNLYIPKLEYCTDNAAMIAMAGHFKYLQGDFAPQDIMPQARLEM
jgi:N6-L-threonylcarbamoyladenine synthase